MDSQIRKVEQTILYKLSILGKIKKNIPLSGRPTFYNYFFEPTLITVLQCGDLRLKNISTP